MKSYYEAYDDRYRQIHERGQSWASDQCTPLVLQILERYCIKKDSLILEIGCGEGRDSSAVLAEGYGLLATDVSEEAISYCRGRYPEHRDSFKVLDCLKDKLDAKFSAIFSVAVIHMLVLDSDRKAFYSFIEEHLADDGIALVCSMGDGEREFQTDIAKAFTLQRRDHCGKSVMVAGTSCRMVSLRTFEKEIGDAGLEIVEQGLTTSLPDFDSMLYAVVKKKHPAVNARCLEDNQ